MKDLDYNRIDNEICSHVVSGDRSGELMERISREFGPRVPGTKGMKSAIAFLAEKLGKLLKLTDSPCHTCESRYPELN